jgi:hypothetical protein
MGYGRDTENKDRRDGGAEYIHTHTQKTTEHRMETLKVFVLNTKLHKSSFPAYAEKVQVP